MRTWKGIHERIQRTKSFLIAHPFYFGSFPILLFYALFAMLQMQADVLVIPLLVQTLATALIYMVVLVLLRNADKAAIVTTIFVSFFFSLTYLFLLDQTLIFLSLKDFNNQCMHWLAIGIWSFLFGMFLLVLITKQSLEKPRKRLNEIGLFLVVLELLVIATHEAQVKFLWEPQQDAIYSSADRKIYREALKSSANRLVGPNVYCILLDANPNHFVLNEFYSYDNQWFVDELRKRGFVVPMKSHCNYPWTLLSLSSWLNMTYLTELDPICGKGTTDWSALIGLIRNSRVTQLFRNAGYEIIQFGSAAPPSDWTPYATNVMFTNLNVFSVELIRTSLLAMFPGTDKYLDEVERQHRLFVLDKLAALPSSSKPKFVFAHLICPHKPYIFDREGGSVRIMEEFVGEKWSSGTKEGFKNQTIFLEHKILQTIDGILADSKTQPIIVLQGDHGSCSSGSISVPLPNEDALVERYGCLSAYLVPPEMRGSIYENISPVNILRLVCNKVLGTKFSVLPDTCYYPANPPCPFQFQDVTKRIAKRELDLRRVNDQQTQLMSTRSH